MDTQDPGSSVPSWAQADLEAAQETYGMDNISVRVDIPETGAVRVRIYRHVGEHGRVKVYDLLDPKGKI